MPMATLLARYGLLSRQGSPSGSSPAVLTGWGATSPCADTRAGANALDSATANPQTSLPFFAICYAPLSMARFKNAVGGPSPVELAPISVEAPKGDGSPTLVNGKK